MDLIAHGHTQGLRTAAYYTYVASREGGAIIHTKVLVEQRANHHLFVVKFLAIWL